MRWIGDQWRTLPRPRLMWAIANVAAIALAFPLIVFMVVCERLIPARKP